MNLKLQREASENDRTYGKMYVDGVYQCETLEDVIREVADQPVESWKVYGKTAIPSGRYKIIVSYSNHFARNLPELIGVKGYAGVRIHPGNVATQTEGCLLVGETRGDLVIGVKKVNAVLASQVAFSKLFDRINEALARNDEVWIDVLNPAA